MQKQDIENQSQTEENKILKVTYRNYKTGLVQKQDPYTLRIVGDGSGNKIQYIERPSGSGNLFDMNGTPVGRWDAKKPEGDRFLKGAEHIAWQRPETEDEKLSKTLIASQARIDALEKELAAVKAEKEKKKDKGA